MASARCARALLRPIGDVWICFRTGRMAKIDSVAKCVCVCVFTWIDLELGWYGIIRIG